MSELKPVTHESMEKFINANPVLCSAVKATLIQWGDSGDASSLEHFREFVVIVATEAIEHFRQHHESKNWKNYNA